MSYGSAKSSGSISESSARHSFSGSSFASSDSSSANYQMTIKYDWSGSGMYDLDTSTHGFGEELGWSCTNAEFYMHWITGDDTSQDGFEQVDARVDDAKTDGLWTSSTNIECYAGWYIPASGSGSAQIVVEYRGDTKTKTISPGEQSTCASTHVATITVYSTLQLDGTYFDLV